jgi:teichuronic acid biosynthesis glycosyltransferase TuaC
VVSPSPLSTEPGRAASIRQQLGHMNSMADIRVFTLHPLYPRIALLQPRSFLYERNEFAVANDDDLRVTYVRYPAVPFLTRPLNGIAAARRLFEYVADFRPDVVLSYCIYPDAFAAISVARKLGVPVIAGARGSDLLRISDAFTRHQIKRALQWCDYVIAVSSELISKAVELGACKDRTRVIPNGCETSIFFPAERDEAKRELALPNGCQLVTFVGRLVRLKGLSELLTAFKSLLGAHPSLVLACIGDGPLMPELRELCATMGIQDRVYFTGNLPATAVARWLAASDLFCLPSHSEGCPSAVIEALACGRPVVATDVGGIPDLIRPSCGILVPPKNSGALQSAIGKALSTDWDALEISRSFTRTWRDVAAETYSVCEELLSDVNGTGELDSFERRVKAPEKTRPNRHRRV